MGAASPAKQATQWLAPAAPVFAGWPAPTELAPVFQKLSKTIASTIKANRVGRENAQKKPPLNISGGFGHANALRTAS
ncbi:hypothetical protein C6A77_14925 [Pseudomonas sp. AFG_SD02_1510_Pfu_092]|nr:hypothetical protein C6A77_14925 [Pseudomonas sp. AFG_SD02_1510_Pfu_092]